MDLENEMQQMLFLNGVLAFAPQLINMYPHIELMMNKGIESAENYLGDNDKMIVIVRKNNRTMAIVLNPKKEFTISNECKLEASEDPTIKVYDLRETHQKILNSSVVLSLKEKYEKKLASGEITNETSSDVLNIVKDIK